MTAGPGRATFWLASPAGVGALGLIELRGAIDDFLAALGAAPLAIGRAGLRRLPPDDVVLARWSGASATMMPHGGVAVLEAVRAFLRARGGEEHPGAAGWPDEATLRALYPESKPGRAGLVEARVLHALGGGAGCEPCARAVDLLLDQPRRWRQGEATGLDALPASCAAALRGLLRPPTVMALGPPNIGKSSLLNALAGREVAVTGDAPGTTLDHVGVTLDLDGLTVRYLDAPGLDAEAHRDDESAQAQALALAAARHVDLVLLCADAGHGPIDWPPPGSAGAMPRCVRVGLRADLGVRDDVLVSVSVRRDRAGAGAGLDVSVPALARHLRRVLLPDEALLDPRAWRFWEEPAGAQA